MIKNALHAKVFILKTDSARRVMSEGCGLFPKVQHKTRMWKVNVKRFSVALAFIAKMLADWENVFNNQVILLGLLNFKLLLRFSCSKLILSAFVYIEFPLPRVLSIDAQNLVQHCSNHLVSLFFVIVFCTMVFALLDCCMLIHAFFSSFRCRCRASASCLVSYAAKELQSPAFLGSQPRVFGC